MKRHLPNVLTGLRLLAAPVVFGLMLRHQWSALIPLFIAIAVTDSLDGYLARKWNAMSRLGAYLDPIADKLLLSGSFLFLALSGGVEWWLTGVVLGRDIGILAGAGLLYSHKTLREFPPTISGKASSFTQILFVCFQVGALSGIQVEPIAIALKYAVAVLVLTSAADYARRLWTAD